MTKQRTLKQNKALHVYYSELATLLNESGLDMRKTLKADISIPWDSKTVKEYLWRPIQEAQLGKKSTTDLEIKEIDKVYNTLNRHLGDSFGLTVPFPSFEGLLLAKGVGYEK